MDSQSPNHPISNPQSHLPPSPLPKAEWTPPLLRVTPIAETAGTKVDPGFDGDNALVTS